MSDTWPIPLLYEDESTRVFHKPAGMPSVRARHEKNMSVADILAEHDPESTHVGPTQDCGVVHRLDNDTSGCLIAARTQETYNALRQQFSDGSVEKEYWAIVIGQPTPHGQIDIPICNDPKSHKRMRCAQTREDGLAAHTEWMVLKSYFISPVAPAGVALVQLRITTGVRHQIRVHMAQLGHPLAGDVTYQSRSQRTCDRLNLPHHLLHARRISFLNPTTHQHITCEAPLPPLFKRTLKTLDEMKKRR